MLTSMKLVQRVSVEVLLKASRLRPSPEKLARVIQLANSFRLSDKSEPASIDEIFKAFHAKQSDEGLDLIAEYNRQINQMGDIAREFIGPVRQETFADVHERYGLLQASRNALLALTRTDIGSEIELDEPGQTGLIRLRVDASGKVTFQHTLLLEALNGIEANRLRRCQTCGDFFWAGRKDQRGCTAKCSHVIRTQRWRDKYQDKYKQHRYEKGKKGAKPKATRRQFVNTELIAPKLRTDERFSRGQRHRRSARLPGSRTSRH